MKRVFIALTFILIFATSCNRSRVHNNKPQETPTALQDEGSSAGILSKRYDYNNLVESLYREIAEKTPVLKNLETKISEIHEGQQDSTILFDKYDEKNKSYYNAADRHIGEIHDSSLRVKMKSVLLNSLEKYNSSISNDTSLLKSLNAKTTTLGDLHNALKIIKTLPVIEKYQRDNKTSTEPVEGLIKEVDGAIKLTNTLMKK
jgi:hypothetical protein